MAKQQELLSTGEIAKRLGVDRDRVTYVIRSRGIEPAGWIGRYRAFDGHGLRRVREAIKALDRKRASA